LEHFRFICALLSGLDIIPASRVLETFDRPKLTNEWTNGRDLELLMFWNVQALPRALPRTLLHLQNGSNSMTGFSPLALTLGNNVQHRSLARQVSRPPSRALIASDRYCTFSSKDIFDRRDRQTNSQIGISRYFKIKGQPILP
jgi:hypothetical protein